MFQEAFQQRIPFHTLIYDIDGTLIIARRISPSSMCYAISSITHIRIASAYAVILLLPEDDTTGFSIPQLRFRRFHIL